MSKSSDSELTTQNARAAQPNLQAGISRAQALPNQEVNRLVTMRLSRIGSTKRTYYRIVVIDKRRARNGRFLEVLGKYNPIANPAQLEINAERAQYWLAKGAAPSETVRSILRQKGLQAPTLAGA